MPEADGPAGALDALSGGFGTGESLLTVRREGSRLFLESTGTRFPTAIGMHPLFPLSDSECAFVSGESVHRIRFVRGDDGAVTRLCIDGQEDVERALLPYSCREVEFAGTRGKVSGTLTLPQGEGPHPAIAFVHGSGPHTRGYFLGLSRLYARNGVASLIWDKPGCGDSAGDFADDIADHTGDALAAVACLRKMPQVDPGRIGLWGMSQAGWVIAGAASRDPRIAFAVLVVCCAEPTSEQDRTRIRHTLKANGFSDDAIRKAIEATDRLKAAATLAIGYIIVIGINAPELAAAVRFAHDVVLRPKQADGTRLPTSARRCRRRWRSGSRPPGSAR